MRAVKLPQVQEQQTDELGSRITVKRNKQQRYSEDNILKRAFNILYQPKGEHAPTKTGPAPCWLGNASGEVGEIAPGVGPVRAPVMAGEQVMKKSPRNGDKTSSLLA